MSWTSIYMCHLYTHTHTHQSKMERVLWLKYSYIQWQFIDHQLLGALSHKLGLKQRRPWSLASQSSQSNRKVGINLKNPVEWKLSIQKKKLKLKVLHWSKCQLLWIQRKPLKDGLSWSVFIVMKKIELAWDSFYCFVLNSKTAYGGSPVTKWQTELYFI